MKMRIPLSILFYCFSVGFAICSTKSEVQDLQNSLSVPEQSPKVEGPFKKLDGTLLELIAYYAASPFSALTKLNKYTYEILADLNYWNGLLEQRFPWISQIDFKRFRSRFRTCTRDSIHSQEFDLQNSINIFYVIWSEFWERANPIPI